MLAEINLVGIAVIKTRRHCIMTLEIKKERQDLDNATGGPLPRTVSGKNDVFCNGIS